MHRQLLLVVALLPLLLGDGPPARAATPKEIQIVAGQSHILRPGLRIGDIANSNPKVVKDVVDRKSNEIIFFAQRVGTADYIIFDARNRKRREKIIVRVVASAPDDALETLRAELGEIDGITFRAVDNQYFIEGEVTLDSELARVRQLARRHENVISFVTLAELSLQTLAEAIQKEIGLPEVRARVLQRRIILEGRVPHERHKTMAEAVAREIYPEILNHIDVVHK